MIGRLVGTLIEKSPPSLLLDVSGVGYEIEAPMSTCFSLPELGATVTLHTHFVVREDHQALYGFLTASERTLFRALIKVNGVGPKMAIAILSAMAPQLFIECVSQNNVTALTKIPGVGKKTAERLIIEMRGSFKDQIASVAGCTLDMTPTSQADMARKDAQDALMALGYKAQDASKMIKRIYSAELGTDEMIRLALQEMST